MNPEPAAACGTRAGYKRHQANRTIACRPCLHAEAVYQRNARANVGLNQWDGMPNVTDGWVAPAACYAAHVTYRQLDYWARTNLAAPTVQPARGSGTLRLYSRDDILRIAIIKLLLDVGLTLPFIRQHLENLLTDGYLEHHRGAWPALRITLDPNAIARDVDARLLECENQPPLSLVRRNGEAS